MKKYNSIVFVFICLLSLFMGTFFIFKTISTAKNISKNRNQFIHLLELFPEKNLSLIYSQLKEFREKVNLEESDLYFYRNDFLDHFQVLYPLSPVLVRSSKDISPNFNEIKMIVFLPSQTKFQKEFPNHAMIHQTKNFSLYSVVNQ